MFTESKSGRLDCAKKEIEHHFKETYMSAEKDKVLPVMLSLKKSPEPGVSFDLRDIRQKKLVSSLEK